jgi:hypothetical protein
MGPLKNSDKGERLAAVFGVGETSLSNWKAMAACGFCSYAAEKKLYPDHKTRYLVQ